MIKNDFQKVPKNKLNQFAQDNWVTPEIININQGAYVNAEAGAKLLQRQLDQPFCKTKEENGKSVKTTFTNDSSGTCLPNCLPDEEKPRSFWIIRDNPDFVEVQSEPKKVINQVATPLNQNNMFFFPKGTSNEQLKATSPIVITIGLLPTLAIKKLLNPEYLGKTFLTDLTEDTLVIGLANEWAWRNSKDATGKKLDKATPIADFDLINWENRSVCLVFGANVRTEEMAEKARQMLKRELENRKAKVYIIDLPNIKGVDSVDHLLAHPEGGDGLVLSLFDGIATQKENATPATPAANPFIFYSIKQVLEFADPEMLISNILPCNAFAVVFGQSGVCKSFFSLHLAFCIALARQDIFPVKHGGVVYISAEGKAGIKPRLESWLNYFKSEIPDNFHYIFSPLNAMDENQVANFIIEIEKICPKPQLIVIDTLARCLIGGDENSAKDVGLFINGCDKLKEATSATVLLVHHTSKNTNTERGSSALRGAADTMILIESDKIGDNAFVTVTCEKQKDLAPFETLAYELTPFENSCVLLPSAYQKEDKKSKAENRNKEYLNLFLTDDPHDKGISWSNVKKFLDLSDSSMNQVTNRLVKDEFVRRDGEKRSVMLFITDKGKSWLTNQCATK